MLAANDHGTEVPNMCSKVRGHIENSTCFCDEVKRANSRLVVRRAKVQADGEHLTSPHDKTVDAVEISAMISVVELTFQVPAINVESFK